MEKLSYEEAVAELESVVKRIEDPQVDMADIKGLIKRANELAAFCREELIGYEKEFSALLEEK